MKILELRFKNLNSLYGEWIIDLGSAEYSANGIFALTGPTGAGKSTILDAICLALYGATPRLGKITKSGNEIMSRQTGECYAEVLFESQAGRYRCHWEQRRARKKADGKLQDQEHQIADADTNKPIETKKSLVSGIIEEKTGMDFEQFTRSILLAQGGFDTFLKADVEQKSKILEQITGTEIYSKISMRVHERQRDERQKLNLLLAETSGIVLMEPEQEKEIQGHIELKQKQEVELVERSGEILKAITWLTTIDKLNKEVTNLAEEMLILDSDIETFRPARDKLDWAVRAATLDGSHAMLSAMRKQQLDDQAALKTAEMRLPELEGAANTQAELLKSAEQQTLIAKDKIKLEQPLIKNIRSLDQKLVEQKKTISEARANCKKQAATIDADKQARHNQLEKRSEAEKILETIAEYLTAHRQDEWLISGLAGIEEQFAHLLARQQVITQKTADISNADAALIQATKKLDDSTKQCAIRRQELEQAINKLQQGKDSLSKLLDKRLLREYRTEKETLLREMVYLRKIEELEAHRLKLEDGKPCPLCGSKEHPFAEGNVPVPDDIEQQIEALSKRISKAEDIELANKKREAAEAVAHKNLTDSEKLEATALSTKKATEKSLADLKQGLEQHRIDFESLKLAVSRKLEPLGIMVIPDTNLSLLYEELKSRLDAWQEQFRKKAEIEKHIADINSEIKRLDAVIETQSTALAEKHSDLERLKKEYAVGNNERKKLYGDKQPDNEEYRLNKAQTDAEAIEKQNRILTTELQQKLITARTHVESLHKRIEQREPELKKTAADFSLALNQAGFADEKLFLEARLTNEEQQALSSRAKALDKSQTELKARHKDREARLASETAKQISDKTLDELQPQFNEYEESLKILRDSIAAYKHRLSENSAAKKRIKEKQNAIEAQKNECHRWDKLHVLIGSADGKKYRNFAQGLTFELMVTHANRQLEKMTDRYLLIRDDQQPLELNVIDNYQAGEIRSSRNLSGGESFIVSLTLALGLSKMASRKVRVDSLFLDEGFGTLDEESLETALETLSGLQQDGKLIGIISHVSALKERISTRITISPASGGRSLLTGPGCRRI